MTREVRRPHDLAMQLTSTLAWLVDAAAESAAPTGFWRSLARTLIRDGLPLAGGALTLDVPHPLIARRTWLWRADNGEVIEASGLCAGGTADAAGPARRRPASAGSQVLPPVPCTKA